MDVTSLLNANSVAAEQQRKMERGEPSRTPTRNRTPWDAGGYSLPINTLSNSTHNTPPQNQNIHLDDSQHQTSASVPTSPRHKFSDSHSSLSSFTSSLQSTTHSRFSSTSTTVSGTQPFGLTDNLSPVSNLKIHEMDLAQLPPSDPSSLPHRSLSPTGSLDALALVAEHQMVDQEVVPPDDKMSTSSSGQTPEGTSHSQSRPSSPSDAILIKRATLPSLRLVTGDHELNGQGQNHTL